LAGPRPRDDGAGPLVHGLVAGGAETLAEYEHPHFGRLPAVTSHAAGSGRITYVGTVPSLGLARDVLRWATARARLWTGLPAEVTATTATSRDGAGRRHRRPRRRSFGAAWRRWRPRVWGKVL
jgi:beta-galactosidase